MKNTAMGKRKEQNPALKGFEVERVFPLPNLIFSFSSKLSLHPGREEGTEGAFQLDPAASHSARPGRNKGAELKDDPEQNPSLSKATVPDLH